MAYFSELIKTEYAMFVWIAVVFISVTSFLASVKGFFEFCLWVTKVKAERTSDFNLAKRSMVKTFVGLVFLGVAWSSGTNLYRSYLNGKKVFVVTYNDNLIANKKTGTIHLKGISYGELPSKEWETKEISLVKNRPYSGSERIIYEQIGIEALTQKNDTIAIEAYLLAISFSPLSYHLYDKLTRIYGRKKEYTNIAKLYDNALINISKLSLNKRDQKRANKEFLMRIQRTKFRAQLV